jgi:hypothetical protein
MAFSICYVISSTTKRETKNTLGFPTTTSGPLLTRPKRFPTRLSLIPRLYSGKLFSVSLPSAIFVTTYFSPRVASDTFLAENESTQASEKTYSKDLPKWKKFAATILTSFGVQFSPGPPNLATFFDFSLAKKVCSFFTRHFSTFLIDDECLFVCECSARR